MKSNNVLGKQLFEEVCSECSAHITKRYSTSFSLGISMFPAEMRKPIYNIYGFVRFADEIVDTFHEIDKKYFLDKFEADTWEAIRNKVSFNPVLQSFQDVFHRYSMEDELVQAFLDSMRMDLTQKFFSQTEYKKYIYGSAEVIGLMCLHVFLGGDKERYNELKPYAQSLGSAFQKVNFLRDIKSDYEERGRVYFPNIDPIHFSKQDKEHIEEDIREEFEQALIGIRELPQSVRLGVFLAYRYYKKLLDKIQHVPTERILTERIRIPNSTKMYVMGRSYLKYKIALI